MSSSFLGPDLCYDVLLHILDALYRDFGTLYQCSLVNWVFNRAASSIMYARVKLSPPFKRVLDLKDKGEIPVG
jgi:hypothetical protein